MSKKYQIFVSSTFKDLKDQRDSVIKTILEMGHIPVCMEMFSAANEKQWSIIQKLIDQSDYYIAILANRYGSITDEDISYTEKEYDHAVSQGIPTLGFVLDNTASWPIQDNETDPSKVSALKLFRDKLERKPVSFWKNSDDLCRNCSIALVKAFEEDPREGWVRASQHTDEKLTDESARLSSENAKLQKKLEDLTEIKELIIAQSSGIL